MNKDNNKGLPRAVPQDRKVTDGERKGHAKRKFAFHDNLALSGLSKTAIRVAIRLSYHYVLKYDLCFPSVELLANELRVDERSIRFALKELKAGGWIQISKEDRQHNPRNIYDIQWGWEGKITHSKKPLRGWKISASRVEDSCRPGRKIRAESDAQITRLSIAANHCIEPLNLKHAHSQANERKYDARDSNNPPFSEEANTPCTPKDKSNIKKTPIAREDANLTSNEPIAREDANLSPKELARENDILSPNEPIARDALKQIDILPPDKHSTNGQENKNLLFSDIPNPANEYAFTQFWFIYPRKVSKKPARRVFDYLVTRQGVAPELIISGAQRYAAQVAADRTPQKFIKYPNMWLDDSRWEDEVVDPLLDKFQTSPHPLTDMVRESLRRKSMEMLMPTNPNSKRLLQ